MHPTTTAVVAVKEEEEVQEHQQQLLSLTPQDQKLPPWLLGVAKAASYCGVTSRRMAEDAVAWSNLQTPAPEQDINAFLAFTRRGRSLLHVRKTLLCPNNPFCIAAIYRARDVLRLWSKFSRALDDNPKLERERASVLCGASFDCWKPESVTYLEAGLALFSEHFTARIGYGAICQVQLWL